MMWETKYVAFDTAVTTTSRTCNDATAQLRLHLSPVHATPWNCVFSESKNMWFREECHVKTLAEKIVDDDFWKTPGGVMLAFFIAFLCVFSLWWMSLCYRNRQFIGVCEGMRIIDFDNRLTGKRRYMASRLPKEMEEDDDDLIHSLEETRVTVHGQGRNRGENTDVYNNNAVN